MSTAPEAPEAVQKLVEPFDAFVGALAELVAQRELSRLSLRELARMSQVPNAYLSQVERGMHGPSLRVLAALAGALSLPLEDLTAQASRCRACEAR
jgi:transcriptional regulator with XRE-family HTH domain